MRIRLVAGARRAWKWFSVQALAALVVLPLIWMELPDDLKAWIPEAVQPWIVAAIAVAGIIGRLIDQGGDDA